MGKDKIRTKRERAILVAADIIRNKPKGNRNKQRGNEAEREIVKLFQSYGFEAERARGSDGRAMGEHEEVDIRIKSSLAKNNVLVPYAMKFQVKRRKADLPQWLGLTEHVDGTIVRKDGRGKESWVVFRLKDFIDMFLKRD